MGKIKGRGKLGGASSFSELGYTLVMYDGTLQLIYEFSSVPLSVLPNQ